MRALVASVLLLGCTTSPRPRPQAIAPATPPQVAIRARIRLEVVDPTDLQARLASLLRRELAARGVATTTTKDQRDLFVAHVVVLTRRRHDEHIQTHDPGPRPATGFGLAGDEEQFEFGAAYTQSDLRMSVSAALFRPGSSVTIANWDDEEGTLFRNDSDVRPRASPWQAVYAAVAAKLANQIATAIAQAK